MITCYYESPIGSMLLAEENGALTGAWFLGQKYFPENTAPEQGDSPVLSAARGWLDRYFNGGQPSPQELPLDPKGSAFRQKVWTLLQKIPYGQTVSYAELANRLAQQQGVPRMSAQAVGGAVGHNPISVIIPCHRVIGKDGSLTGYAGGLERKAALLEWECSMDGKCQY